MLTCIQDRLPRDCMHFTPYGGARRLLKRTNPSMTDWVGYNNQISNDLTRSLFCGDFLRLAKCSVTYSHIAISCPSVGLLSKWKSDFERNHICRTNNRAAGSCLSLSLKTRCNERPETQDGLWPASDAHRQEANSGQFKRTLRSRCKRIMALPCVAAQALG